MKDTGARRLKEFLDEHDVTAITLAAKCGMAPAQLCHIVKGRRKPTLEQAVALLRYARIPVGSWK